MGIHLSGSCIAGVGPQFHCTKLGDLFLMIMRLAGQG